MTNYLTAAKRYLITHKNPPHVQVGGADLTNNVHVGFVGVAAPYCAYVNTLPFVPGALSGPSVGLRSGVRTSGGVLMAFCTLVVVLLHTIVSVLPSLRDVLDDPEFKARRRSSARHTAL
jgi:hypothetical protein